MKITHGAAFGTGGGWIAVIGEIDNGLWFFGDNYYGCVLNFDTRTTSKEMKVGNKDDDLAIFWLNETDNKGLFVDIDQREIDNMYHDFCVRYDCKEPDITKGYENWDGCFGRLCDYIDWSYMKIDGYSKPSNFRDIMYCRLDESVDNILSDIQSRLDIEEVQYDSESLDKAKETLVNEMIKLLNNGR